MVRDFCTCLNQGERCKTACLAPNEARRRRIVIPVKTGIHRSAHRTPARQRRIHDFRGRDGIRRVVRLRRMRFPQPGHRALWPPGSFSCHSEERSDEESKADLPAAGRWLKIIYRFRSFTPLRFVQNDRKIKRPCRGLSFAGINSTKGVNSEQTYAPAFHHGGGVQEAQHG